MSPKVKRIVRTVLRRAVGYPLFFIACFVFFAYHTFPYARAKDAVLRKVSSQLGPGVTLEASSLEPSWLTGVDVRNLRIHKAASRPKGEPLDVTVDALHARAGLFAALSGAVALSFDGKLAGGTFDGELHRSDTAQALRLELDGVHVAALGLGKALLGIPIKGVLSGKVHVDLPKELQQSTGDLDLSIAGCSVGDGKAKLHLSGMPGGLTIETLNLGTLDLRGQLNGVKGRISEITAHGQDADIDGNGEVQLVRPLARSRVSLLARVQFADAYKHRNDRTEALFSLLDFTPGAQSAKTSSGALQYEVVGALGGPINARPAGSKPLEPPGG